MPASDSDAATHCIVIVPNRSPSAAELWVFYVSLAALTLMLAAWLTWQGYWPVMVWAVLELLLLAFCQYLCLRRARYTEVITISGDRIRVERGEPRHRRREEFSRYWAQVVLSEPQARLHPRRLLIRSHGRECELGRCLTESERERLGRRLGELIGPAGQ